MSNHLERLIDQFDNVFIHRDSRDSQVSDRLISLFPESKIHIVDEKPRPEKTGHLSSNEFEYSKRNIYVTPHRGSFFKRCPGAKPGLVCCNYFVLNLGLQCNMNCSYCYLQSYLNTPLLTIYSNIEEALQEIDQIATQHPDLHYRVGTGETIDSLSLDPLTLYSSELITFFKKYPKWTLELKTKSNAIDQLLDIEHADNVLISWSINPQFVIKREEHGTASFNERIAAARKSRDHGFQIGFNFDPMIYHENWKENYSQMVKTITSAFSPSELQILTAGSLRFQPEQRFMMKERFGMKSLVNQGEMFLNSTGKMRYDSELRNEMFQFLIDTFKEASRDWHITLCMEVPETWATTMASTPRKIPEIRDLFEPRPRA